MPEPLGEAPTLRDALAGLRSREWLASEGYQAQLWGADAFGLHPAIVAFIAAMQAEWARLGVPLYAAVTKVSAERQGDAFALAQSSYRGGESPHQWGCAVDIIHGVLGYELTGKQWALIGHMGGELVARRGLHLAWGGVDEPEHWEVRDWRSQRKGYPWPTKELRTTQGQRVTLRR